MNCVPTSIKCLNDVSFWSNQLMTGRVQVLKKGFKTAVNYLAEASKIREEQQRLASELMDELNNWHDNHDVDEERLLVTEDNNRTRSQHRQSIDRILKLNHIINC